MNAYDFEISRATKAADLHQLSDEIKCDDTLDEHDREELLASIANKFGQWNQQAAGEQKPRWK